MLQAEYTLQYSLPEITFPEVILSQHAQTRIQQRGIKNDWIALVLEYGHYIYQSGKHVYTISLDKSGIKQIKKKFGDSVELSKLRHLYLILSDESVVVTCAYR
jgi:uncharacterized protein YjlB